MRLKGVIKSWNDERGFGFIEPVLGGEDIFVHIKAFSHRAGRPQVSQRVLFDVELGPQGKLRARNVELSQFGQPGAQKVRLNLQPQRGAVTLITLPVFGVLYVIASLLWETPLWLALVYLLASAVTFLVYANDKSCAQRGMQRTPEGTLHLLSLVGGWPGALLAQQFLRHKSSKAEFRTVFWFTVVFNVAAFLTLCSSFRLLN